MRKDKYLFICGSIAIFSGIIGVILARDPSFQALIGWAFPSGSQISEVLGMILNCGFVMIAIGFITKHRLDSGKIYTDERIIKVAYKSIARSWYTTLILTSFTLLLISLGYITSLTSYQAVSMIFWTQIMTYILSFYFFKNTKV